MRKLIVLIFMTLIFPTLLSSQIWKTNIIVRGNLPEGTNIQTFQNQVRTAIENNVDSASYVFDIRIVSNDSVYYQSRIDIEGEVKASKNLKTFEDQVNTFFMGKFDNAVLRVRFFHKREW